MKSIKQSMFVAVFGIFAVLGGGQSLSAAEVQPNAIQSACQRNIQNAAARITKLAYVTSKSCTGVDYVKGTVYVDNSFHLTYKFYYRDSDNDPQWFTLRFEHNASGGLTDVKSVAWSSFWEPFNFIKIAGGILKEVAKELDK